MPSLVAIALPTGAAFARELALVWERGDAVLPVDPRLPVPAGKALLDAMRPDVIVDESGERQRQPGAVPVEDGDALVVATSGTTGMAKGVVLTYDAVTASAKATSRRLDVSREDDCWLAMLPVAHIGGLSVVTRALETGTRLTFDPDDYSATLTSVVPTQANRLDLTRFRKVLVGGSSDWLERPKNVVRTYGMTETGSGVVYNGLPLEGVEVRTDADGQIFIRGPMLLRAMRDGSDPKTADGWLPTGDAGTFAAGVLTVHGRMDDLVITGGEKVWPTPVEDAIRSHPGVADVAVAGRPDAEWGAAVVAWIVAVAGAEAPTLDSVRDHVKQTLPAYAAPRRVVVVDSLPRTSLGKVNRKLLPDTC